MPIIMYKNFSWCKVKKTFANCQIKNYKTYLSLQKELKFRKTGQSTRKALRERNTPLKAFIYKASG
ncbi:MAG TPA: hypothetical protein DCL96_05070 [Prevotella sp.]|jgi:hypothetical protein|uniref:Uncharacterized protein n=1 Tax=Segatella copri TaxID=165179 RepID=A0AA92TR48_9BACT|nr:hypothetical protein DWW35_09440 [Segatella copri]HAH91074.1 hypothetical protein [Prevotella sp.]